MATYGYARVSTEGQEDGTSLDEQAARIAAFCKARGWELTATFRDVASGTTFERDEFKEMSALLAPGDRVVVLALSRFSRSLPDGYPTLMAWEKRGIAMHSATEPFDTGSAMGRHMLRIVLEFAHAEREVLLERIEAGRRRKAAGGGWNGGVVPYGYRRAPKSSPKELVIEPAEAAVVKDLFRVYSTGRYSLVRAAAVAGCLLSETAILELLGNPVYTGRLRYHGTVRAARHDRIVSDRAFRRAREVRRMRSRGGVADSTKAVVAPTESAGACSVR